MAAVPIPLPQLNSLPETWRQKSASLQLQLHQIKVRTQCISLLRGSKRLQSGGNKRDEWRYAKQGGVGKMQNLLTHCNHQAGAQGATGSQGKSSSLSFRRTK